MKRVLMYHGSCLDGSSAAAVFKMKYSDAILIPVRHGFDQEALEEAEKNVDADTHLFFIDNMFLINELIHIPKKITVIDHHESNVELGNKYVRLYDNFEYVYRNDMSGATLAWVYFFPDDKDIPKFLLYIEDIDLWANKYPESDIVSTYASLYLDNIEKFIDMINSDISNIYEKGKLLVEYRDMLVDYYLRNAQALHIKVGNHIIKSFNVASVRPIVSLFGNIQSTKTKEAVCMFKVFGNKVNLSFRSTDSSRVSARELAEKLGGGGHKNAAGASISLKDFISILQDLQ